MEGCFADIKAGIGGSQVSWLGFEWWMLAEMHWNQLAILLVLFRWGIRWYLNQIITIIIWGMTKPFDVLELGRGQVMINRKQKTEGRSILGKAVWIFGTNACLLLPMFGLKSAHWSAGGPSLHLLILNIMLGFNKAYLICDLSINESWPDKHYWNLIGHEGGGSSLWNMPSGFGCGTSCDSEQGGCVAIVTQEILLAAVQQIANVKPYLWYWVLRMSWSWWQQTSLPDAQLLPS